jgi:membrane associated rhomboid family serine protease
MLPLRDHNPSKRTPFVTYGLIAANVLIFLSYLPLFENERQLMLFYLEWGVVPARLSAGEGWSGILTSQFLHGGWLHLAGNMLFLWIFGDNMEEEWGHLRFLGFYLASGAAAAGLQYAAAPESMVPMVGASGAIAGVLGGYLLLFPRARVDVLFYFLVFFRIIPLPAWAILGAWFGLQVFGGVVSVADQGGVAYWAHAGGFAAGLAMTLPIWAARGGPGFWRRTSGAPPHPEARYRLVKTSVPRVRRRGRGGPASGPWGPRPGD